MNTMRSRKVRQRGAALLIAVFAMMLISGLAVSLIVMSGTETSIAANYKVTTQAFYASYAGLEEGRARLWQNFPLAAGGSVAAQWYAPLPIGSPVPVGTVMYILNPGPGEVVDPRNLVPSNPYADNQYTTEWGTPVTGAVVKPPINSNAALLGVPGPLYKWVRITTKTERSSRLDVNGDGILDPATPIYTDGANQFLGNVGGSLQQVFRITSLSVTPGGGRRVTQYDAYRRVFNLQVPSALTFDGQGSALFPANSAVYEVDGNDTNPVPANQPPGGCPAPGPPVPGVGVISAADDTAITNAIPNNRINNYTGSGGSTPDVQDISGALPPNLKTVGDLERLVQSLDQSATMSLSVPAGQTTITNAEFTDSDPSTSGLQIGSPAAPEVVVANGPTTLSGAVTGYGILVVTDDFVIKGNFVWQGIILVIGSGYLQVAGGGSGTIDGAMLLARTRDVAGNPLPPGSVPGGSTLDWQGGGGNGIHYSSCNINNANNANATYRVLSFREARE